MSFGTTGRAVLLNRMPLRQRFALAHWMGAWDQATADATPDHVLAAWERQVDAEPKLAPPGWDADGRPVET